MVSLFYTLSHFPPKSKSAFKRFRTWNGNYFRDGVSEWVYSMVGRLLLGLCLSLWIKPWPFCFFWLLFENLICPVLHTPLICTCKYRLWPSGYWFKFFKCCVTFESSAVDSAVEGQKSSRMLCVCALWHMTIHFYWIKSCLSIVILNPSKCLNFNIFKRCMYIFVCFW